MQLPEIKTSPTSLLNNFLIAFKISDTRYQLTKGNSLDASYYRLLLFEDIYSLCGRFIFDYISIHRAI